MGTWLWSQVDKVTCYGGSYCHYDRGNTSVYHRRQCPHIDDVTSQDGDTAIHIAAATGQVEVLKLLHGKDVDVDLTNAVSVSLCKINVERLTVL